MYYRKVIAGLLAVSLCAQCGMPVLAAERGIGLYGTETTETVAEAETAAEDRDIPDGAAEKPEDVSDALAEDAGSEEEAYGDGRQDDAAEAVPAANEDAERADITDEVPAEENTVADSGAAEEIVDAAEDMLTANDSADASEEAVITVFNEEDLEYTGYAVKPIISVKYGKKTLKEGTDYTVAYENNVNAGTARGLVKGTGDYSFEKAFEFTIAKHVLEEKDVQTLLGAYEVRYKKHSYGFNQIFVAVGSKTLEEDVDYRLSDTTDFDNNVSGAKVTVTGIGNCTGSVTTGVPEYEPVTYDIKGTFVYGEPGETDVTVKIGSKVLTRGEKEGDGDYYVTVENTSDRIVQVTVNGKYQDAELYEYSTFRVSSRELKDSEVSLAGEHFEYTGKPVKPAVSVTVNGTALKENDDYVLSYKNNTAVGTASVTVTGTGHYTGTVEKSFFIEKHTAVDDSFAMTLDIAPGTPEVYTGSAITPNVSVVKTGSDVKVLKKGTDFTVTYENNVNAGTAVAHVRGKGQYSFEKDLSFTIVPKSLTAAGVEKREYLGATQVRYKNMCSDSNRAGFYDAERETELVEGTDYVLENKDAYTNDKGSAVAKGKGNYTGTVTFEIPEYEPMYVDCRNVFVYGDIGYMPDISLIVNKGTSKEKTLKRGQKEGDGDFYVISSVNSNNPSLCVYDAIGRYNGFEIAIDELLYAQPRPLEKGDVSLAFESAEYTGKAIKPAVTVKSVGGDGKPAVLSENTDYTVSYKNNVNTGTAKAVVTGKGYYKGTIEKTFTITKGSAPAVKEIVPEITLSKTSFVYNGKTQVPYVTIKDGDKVIDPSCYDVKFSGTCIDAGTYKLSVELKGGYKGSAEAVYEIRPKQITPSVTLSSRVLVYNGNVRTPGVTVKDGSVKIPSSEYTVRYASGRKNVGTYGVAVTLKGNYTGKASVKFTIKPMPTNITKFKAVSGKLAFNVEWKKQAVQTTGYQLQYSTDSSFGKNVKTVTVKGAQNTKKVITGVQSGKYYYIRIRTYRTAFGKDYYSNWTVW